MKRLSSTSSRKRTVNMPQNKPKNKLLNRVFAMIFVLYTLICTYYVTVWDLGVAQKVTVFLTATWFFIIIAGLLIEVWKPSLSFAFHRKRRWVFISIILLAIFVLLNTWWWVAAGIPHLLPEQGWQITFTEYFSKVFASDTSILALMFGILFLTNSNPRKSLSYKIMLVGALIMEIQLFMGHILLVISGGVPGSLIYGNYWGYTIFQPYYWMDIISQISVSIGVVCLLRTSMNIKKLILAIIIFFIVFIMLSGPFLLKP